MRLRKPERRLDTQSIVGVVGFNLLAFALTAFLSLALGAGPILSLANGYLVWAFTLLASLGYWLWWMGHRHVRLPMAWRAAAFLAVIVLHILAIWLVAGFRASLLALF